MISLTSFRRFAPVSLCFLLLMLCTPLITRAAEATVQTTRYQHCGTLNARYDALPAAEKRCGDKIATEALVQDSTHGPFLCGICNACIARGECDLTDVLIVTGNAGNFLLAIIGSLALILFVIGGFLIMTSQGESRLATGKQFLFASGAGIVMTFSAVLILRFVLNVVTTGTPGSGSAGYAICDGTNNGAACGEASVCDNGNCTGRCAVYQASVVASGNTTASYQCTDPASYPSGACVSGLCPGGNDNKCCNTDFLEVAPDEVGPLGPITP